MRWVHEVKVPRVVVIGVGGAGRHTLNVLHDVLAHDSSLKVESVGVLDDSPSEKNLRALAHAFPDYPFLGGVSEWLEKTSEPTHFVIGIGAGHVRRHLDQMLSGAGHLPLTLVHPNACIGQGVTLGPGTVVSDHAAVDTCVTSGRSVHINQGVVVGHDSHLGDYVSLNPSSNVSGNVRIGESVLVGAASTIIQGVAVGRGSTVGMGAAVIKDVAPEDTVIGVPARSMKRETK